jgi:hypothetical protein
MDQLHINHYQIQETNARLGVGFLVMFFYLLIGAIVFVRIEKPVETIEMDTYLEFRQEWTKRLLKKGITGNFQFTIL